MSPKKDSSKVMDMLEKMGMVKKVDDELDSAAITDAADEAVTSPVLDYTDIPEPEFASARPQEPAPSPAYAVAPETPYGISREENSLFWDESPATGNEVDGYLDIELLYRVFGMKTSGVDTVYLLESYIKTLPETLPAELRRSIILKIVAASGFDFDLLLNDGIDRVSRLNDYSTTFAARTEEIVERHNVEIDALERQIQQIRELINERKNLHKRQFLTIESEAQRLKDVLDFITK